MSELNISGTILEVLKAGHEQVQLHLDSLIKASTLCTPDINGAKLLLHANLVNVPCHPACRSLVVSKRLTQPGNELLVLV